MKDIVASRSKRYRKWRDKRRSSGLTSEVFGLEGQNIRVTCDRKGRLLGVEIWTLTSGDQRNYEYIVLKGKGGGSGK